MIGIIRKGDMIHLILNLIRREVKEIRRVIGHSLLVLREKEVNRRVIRVIRLRIDRVEVEISLMIG